jgi:hypothetical protein
MNKKGTDIADWKCELTPWGLVTTRPMRAEEKAAREEWRRQYIEDAGRHPFRFLLRFFAALGFLAFSIWLVYWQLERGGAFIPIPPGFSS